MLSTFVVIVTLFLPICFSPPMNDNEQIEVIEIDAEIAIVVDDGTITVVTGDVQIDGCLPISPDGEPSQCAAERGATQSITLFEDGSIIWYVDTPPTLIRGCVLVVWGCQ